VTIWLCDCVSLGITRNINGCSFVAVLEGLARELDIAQALGTDRQGRLALWQVIARAIDQGSRLSAVRLATIDACGDLLGLDGFNEEDLYSNLAWLTEQQRHIETRLFEALHPGENKPALFLYDVTSSYLEGTKNQLGAFGYNRDGKRGDADCHWSVVRRTR
jgi:hypothetical protein